MKRAGSRIRAGAGLFSVAVIAASAIVLSSCGAKSSAHTSTVRPAGGGNLVVEQSTVGPAVPAGFLGLTMEFKALEASFGYNPRALDPAFVQLLEDIAPNQSRVLRLGGDSTDWTWWPVPHMTRPPGIKYNLTPTWMSVAHAAATALDARLILGINLEADSHRVSAAEAAAMVHRLGRNQIAGLEIGNEPELYGTFGWYKSAAGRQVPGRPPTYNVSNFFSDYSSFSHSMPPVPLAGPSSGAPKWLADLNSFLRDEPRVRLATVHAYPLKHCTPATHVTIGQVLSDSSSHGLARTVAPYVRAAGAHHVALRVDEMNAVSCGGVRGVSNAFASALWALDTLFELEKVGVNGVNIQSEPMVNNEVLGPSFSRGTWYVRVHPLFYGLMMFAQAAPPGSRLLRLSAPPPAGVKIWATHGPDGHVHVVVINKQVRVNEVVHLAIPTAQGPATAEELRAPSVGATDGVTLGGQTFGSTTTTGVLGGKSTDTTIAPVNGAYVVSVPPATATLLTVPAS